MNDVEVGDWIQYKPMIQGPRPLIMEVVRIGPAGIHLENGVVISPSRVLSMRKKPCEHVMTAHSHGEHGQTFAVCTKCGHRP